MKTFIIAFAFNLVVLASGAHAQQSVEQKVDDLQRELEALKAQMTQQPQAGAESSTATHGMNAQAANSQTIVGGYGEINYNNYDDGERSDVADLKRFVLFFGHKFSDRVRLYSELEVEHAFIAGGDGTSGEVAMEQAFVQYAFSESANLRAGLMLIPSGMLNEYHEPPVFNGVERNEIETRIVPSTWRELGLALQGNVLNGLEYNAGIVTSPDASKFRDAGSGIRQMRVSGNRAAANDLGYFVGLNYRGLPGFLIGASLFTGNTGQNGLGKGNGRTGANASLLRGADAKLTIWELHTRYSVAGFDLRALYAKGTLDDTAAINAAAGLALGSNSAAPESFDGWLAEAAYHVYRKGDIDVVPFARFERYNTQRSVAAGYTIDPRNDEQVTTIGVTFAVHPQVVFKADAQNYDTDSTKDRINLGVGYMF